MKAHRDKSAVIGQRLAAMRKQKGWSQRELADMLCDLLGQEAENVKSMSLRGVNGKQTVSQLERGARGLTIDIAFAYADIFDVSLDYIFCRTDNKQPEYTGIHDLLGLSDEALGILREFKENADILAAYEQDPDPIKLYQKYGGESSQKLMRGKMSVSCLQALNTIIESEPEQGLIYNIFGYIFGGFGRKEKAPYPENISDYQKELLNTNMEVTDKTTGRDALIPYELLGNMFLAQVQTSLARLKDKAKQ